ncbi:MAG: PIN domain-containing protein [Curvibacter sp.]|jgi:hypothetical protein|nr:hypothetical protein [Curvibacter sp.]
MKELHVLVDFENVQPSLAELAERAPGFTDVWLFHGPHQEKQAQQLAAAHARLTPVPRSGKGPNALDFHLSFYLGYVLAKHPDAQLIVIANDQGYDPMIEHAAEVLGFHVKRVGFRNGKAPAAKKAVAAKTPKAAQPAPAKRASAKAVAPAKKVPTEKAAAKKAPAKKVPAQKTPAKKAAVKTAAAKQATPPAPAKKVATKTAPAKKKPAAQAKAPAKKVTHSASPASHDAKEFERIKKGLAKMGDKRPQKLKPFLRHLESMLGQASSSAALDALVKKLEQQNVAHVEGDRVRYS